MAMNSAFILKRIFRGQKKVGLGPTFLVPEKERQTTVHKMLRQGWTPFPYLPLVFLPHQLEEDKEEEEEEDPVPVTCS
jgi:hypothetical protein